MNCLNILIISLIEVEDVTCILQGLCRNIRQPRCFIKKNENNKKNEKYTANTIKIENKSRAGQV